MLSAAGFTYLDENVRGVGGWVRFRHKSGAVWSFYFGGRKGLLGKGVELFTLFFCRERDTYFLILVKMEEEDSQ
jgi:hypothetical protein